MVEVGWVGFGWVRWMVEVGWLGIDGNRSGL